MSSLYDSLPFCPFTADLERTAEINGVMRTLYDFMSGRARTYEVKDALIYLVDEFGDQVRMPCRQFWVALAVDDEDWQRIVCMECYQKIERAVQARHRYIADEIARR